MFRCLASAIPSEFTLSAAEMVPSPVDDRTSWAHCGDLQCALDNDGHEFHCAFLRDSSTQDEEAFLCWDAANQWLMVSEPCGKAEPEGGDTCTAYQNHPGRCRWDLVDVKTMALKIKAADIWARYKEQGRFPPEWDLD